MQNSPRSQRPGALPAPSIADSVASAMHHGGAIVALESTVIAQGLPWNDNLRTALGMEAAVRAAGAVPATIAIIDGRVHIGLSVQQLEMLASSTNSSETTVTKANRRDLATAVASGRTAATTVSATLWLANRFDLEPRVMATGGLGGVHRDSATTGDVSTDLDELARADGSLVVCSGFKSILDLPATLESLETRGVLIVGYQTSELPGFVARSTGFPLEQRVDTPGEAAALVRTHRALGLPGAIVLVQPVPDEHAVDPSVLEQAITHSLAKARDSAIVGKNVTPFLLAAVRDATAGKSLPANIALLIENARLAGLVAALLASPLDETNTDLR